MIITYSHWYHGAISVKYFPHQLKYLELWKAAPDGINITLIGRYVDLKLIPSGNGTIQELETILNDLAEQNCKVEQIRMSSALAPAFEQAIMSQQTSSFMLKLEDQKNEAEIKITLIRQGLLSVEEKIVDYSSLPRKIELDD